MKDKQFSSLNLLLDNVEGTNLLLEYYSSFSKRIFNARDFRSVLNILYEELRKIYANQHIEIILWHNNQKLVKFLFAEQNGQMSPGEDFFERNTLYNYVLEQQQVVLTNSYENFCENLNVSTANVCASSWLGVPMKVRGKVLGALVVWDESSEHYMRLQDKHFLTSITDMVSFAIENIYLYNYIADKNGSLSLLEYPLLTGNTRNTIKSVLSQLLQSVLSQSGVSYSGLFMRPYQSKKWRVINEKYEDEKSVSLGIKLLSGLSNIPESIFEGTSSIFCHQNFASPPLKEVFSESFDEFDINSALLFPFVINQNYTGAWIIGMHRSEDEPDQKEKQFYQFISYLITQLIEKKALLEQHRKYDSYMRHLERMKVTGELASSAAHHLNNVFSVIIGKTQTLQRKHEGDSIEHDLDLILKAASDGANSIRRIQNYSSRRDLFEDSKTIDLNAILYEVVDIARPRFEEQAQARGLHYDLNMAPGEVKPIKGDAAALREVFLNLINNALDAMPRGGKLSLQTTAKENQVLVFVSDTGIGIPNEIQEKIFEQFFTTKGKQGNGLGLSIAAETIKKHKGKIYVDSIPQKGSIFMVELPAAEQEYIPKPAQTEFFQPLAYKVLLVEDEGIVRETLAEMLEDEGCEVTTANNAEDAILKFQKHQCDVVFTDLSMPDLNGVKLAEKLKKLDPDIPIFIITGWNQIDPSLVNSNDVIDGVIQKPFNVQHIRQELIRVAGRNGQFHRNGVTVSVTG